MNEWRDDAMGLPIDEQIFQIQKLKQHCIMQREQTMKLNEREKRTQPYDA